ncbi:hypothetical protein IHE45_14G012300 [Dioscorea alata]|uniref:Uncharacterized protein n=1 Tax=Dioscorea alata TaxID=55571 RepID=A0ACB7UPY7_DIOAL|nr:hypothetical protein IHE45_14G012300 [Dioscorea alata]
MGGGSWRAAEQGDADGDPPAGDWRTQLQPEARQRIVNNMVPAAINPPSLNPAGGNQSNVDPASLDSTAQTGNAGVVDWQEEIYLEIQSMKELYFAELNELYQKLLLKFQQYESQNLLPHAKQSEQIEKMKSFKVMLERAISFLEIPKSSIQPTLKEKLPLYQKQISTFLATNRKPRNLPSQSQFQPALKEKSF